MAVLGQPGFYEADDVFAQLECIRLCLEKGCHRGILARQRPQDRVIVRVWQAANIKQQIGITRHAMLEPEGLEDQGQPILAINVQKIANPGA